jgi:hypothetical protein
LIERIISQENRTKSEMMHKIINIIKNPSKYGTEGFSMITSAKIWVSVKKVKRIRNFIRRYSFALFINNLFSR